MSFKLLSSGCHQFYSSVVHTWDKNRITGFGIDKTGFSVSWTSSTKRWQRTSSVGKLNC